MRSVKLVAALAGAALLIPSVASAQPLGQDLAITTISKTSFGGQQQPLRLVIKNETDYKNFFLGQPPSSPTVDFSSEDVLVAGMGFEPTGGYSIEITRVQVNVGPSAIVTFQETKPAPGVMVPMVVTSPVHVVKVARRATSYTFQSASSPSTAAFDKLSLSYVGGFVMFHETITVDKNGLVTDDRGGVSPSFPSTSYHGHATAAELQKIKDAYKASDFATLPATITPPHIIPDIPSLDIEADQGANKKTVNVVSAASFGAYDARLRPLVDAIRAVADRIVAANAPHDITGKCVVIPGSSDLAIGNVRVPTTSPFRALLATQIGKEVTISATVTQTSGGQIADVKAIVGAANKTAALRAGPSYHSHVLDTVAKDARVEVLGSSSNGYYYKAKVGNDTGWIYKTSVTIGR